MKQPAFKRQLSNPLRSGPPSPSVWGQQAWPMVYNPLYASLRSVALLYAAFAIVFGAIAIVFGSFYFRVHSAGPFEYHCGTPRACACAMNTTCRVSFELREPMRAPAMLYYELSPIFQNNRRYVHSWSYAQLTSEAMLSYSALEDACHPLVNAHNDWTIPPAVPCGLAANTYFTDRFRLLHDDSGVEVALSKAGMARSISAYREDRMPADPRITLADFVTWIRASPLPHFRKAYARIEGGLAAGRYTMEVKVSYDLDRFEGTAAFALSDWSAIGGRHGTLWGIATALCLCSASASLYAYLVSDHSPLQRAAAALAHYAADGEPGLGLASRQVGLMYKALVPRPFGSHSQFGS